MTHQRLLNGWTVNKRNYFICFLWLIKQRFIPILEQLGNFLFPSKEALGNMAQDTYKNGLTTVTVVSSQYYVIHLHSQRQKRKWKIRSIIVNILNFMNNVIKTSEYCVCSDYDFIQVVRICISIAQLFIIFDKDFIRCHYEVDW